MFFENLRRTFLPVSDILSPEPASCHRFLLPAVSGGRKEDKMCAYQKAVMECWRWTLFMGQDGTFQPFLTVPSPSYVTPESRMVTAESNCRSGAVLCQLHFVDGDLWRVTFPPLSQPPH